MKIKVAAPPEDGQANQAVIAYLSKVSGLPKRDIVLHSGATSRQKRFSLQTDAPQQVLMRLAQAMGTSAETCFTLL